MRRHAYRNAGNAGTHLARDQRDQQRHTAAAVREEIMARIKHIALTTKEPAKVAEFYKSAFGLKELRRSPNGAVFLTDGHINVAILNPKDEKSPDMGAHGPNFSGIHHFGFEVDDLGDACQKLEAAHGRRLAAKDGV